MLEADIRELLASKIDIEIDRVVLSDVTLEDGTNIKMLMPPATLAEITEAEGYDEEAAGLKPFFDQCRAEELIA